MIRLLFVLVLAVGLVVPPLAGQTAEVITVRTFPAPVTVACDPPAGLDVDKSKLTYTLSVDGGPPGAAQAECKFTFSVSKAGSHTASIVARVAQADGTFKTSSAAVLQFKAELPVPPVSAPTGRVAPPPPSSANVAKPQPPAKPVDAPFTDPDGHKWTLVGTDVQMDGQHAPDAGPCTKMVLLNGKVYVYGLDLWWLWRPNASPHWANAGPELPK